MDKLKKKPRVQLAACADFEKLNTNERDSVTQHASWHYMILPDIPGLGTYYADLRNIFTVDRSLILDPMRIASMTPEFKELLQARIVGYFVRKQMPTSQSAAEPSQCEAQPAATEEPTELLD
jgi:hypothetical protein